MIGGHGHVTPRSDGAKARCGGPGICAACSRELAQAQNLAEFNPDWTIRPGVLLADEIAASGLRDPGAPAKISGLAPDVIAGVLDGSVQIDETLAAGLARIGGTARLWLALEQRYRADLAAGRKDISDPPAGADQ